MGTIRELFRDIVTASWEHGEHARLPEVFAADYTAHDEAAARAPGPAGLSALVDSLRAGISELRFAVHEQIEVPGALATRFTLSGRHTGTLLGLPASGKPVVTGGMSLNRVQDGKISRGHIVWDADRLRAQLGGPPRVERKLAGLFLDLVDALYLAPGRDKLDDVLAADYHVADAATGERRSVEEQWRFAERLRAGHTDLRFDVLETIESGDEVAAYFVFSATARASGRRVLMPGLSINRAANGQLIHGELVWDRPGFLAQGGAL